MSLQFIPLNRGDQVNRLAGKVALITGGAKGQGAAETALFAAEGAKVYFTDILLDEGRALAESLQQQNRQAFFLPMNVARDSEWAEVVQTVMDKEGRIDILVNNAGISKVASIEETTDELWDQIISVNQKGVFLGMRHVVPIMKKNGGGSIINVASIAGMRGSQVGIAYGASKGAVRFMTKSSALELARFGVRVNTLIPGPIATDMLSVFGTVDPEHTPLGRLGTPEDVAYGALYLASDESSFVTGVDLVIDGGVTTGKAKTSP